MAVEEHNGAQGHTEAEGHLDINKAPRPTPSLTELHREKTATRLAVGLATLFAITILSPIAVWGFGSTPPPDMIEFVRHAMALEGTLLGAAVGFYFSQKRIGS